MEPKTISSLIDQWDTIADFATAIGCGYEAARQMKRRGSIAPEHWPKVVDAAAAKAITGVTFDWLARQRGAQSEAA